MSSDRNVLLFLGVAFFAICTVLILHLIFYSPNRDIGRSVFIYVLIYGSLYLAFKFFKHRNETNYGISVGHVLGGTLGLIAGCYFGYQACILAGLFDGVGPIESSTITVTITLISGTACLQIGSFFGNVLLP